jgi:flagellar FliJ protein
MSKGFSLAGLLRLRHLQQELAAGDLSAARTRLEENGVSQERARIALGASTTDVTSTATLYAVAAGRASLRSTLSDLTALEDGLKADTDAAASAFSEARAQTIGLEKLERKHEERVAAEELQQEQKLLDELASTSWQRDTEGNTPRS